MVCASITPDDAITDQAPPVLPSLPIHCSLSVWQRQTHLTYWFLQYLCYCRVVQISAPQVAFFSSRGPILAGDGNLLKPDITAPGVDVVAQTDPRQTGYNAQAYSGNTTSNLRGYMVGDCCCLAAVQLYGALCTAGQIQGQWLSNSCSYWVGVGLRAFVTNRNCTCAGTRYPAGRLQCVG